MSLAAALAIPATLADGSAFPQRNLILFITFVVILLTLVVQGLTLPYFIRYGGLFTGYNDDPEEVALQKLRKGLKEHSYQFLRERYENDKEHHAGLQLLLQHWEEKMKAANESWMTGETKAIFIELLESQRQYIVEYNKDPAVNEEIVRKQLFQIDLEEERLRMQ